MGLDHSGSQPFNCFSPHKGGGVDYNWTSTLAVLTLTFDSANLEEPQCFQISINDDDLVEGGEFFNVTLRVQNNPSGQVLLKINESIVTIADNDGELINCKQSVSSVCSYTIKTAISGNLMCSCLQLLQTFKSIAMRMYRATSKCALVTCLINTRPMSPVVGTHLGHACR